MLNPFPKPFWIWDLFSIDMWMSLAGQEQKFSSLVVFSIHNHCRQITSLSFLFIKNELQLHFSVLQKNAPQPQPLRMVYRDGILSVSIIYCTPVSHMNVLILRWHFDLVSFLPCLLPSVWVNGSYYAIYPNEKAIASIAISEYRTSNIICQEGRWKSHILSNISKRVSLGLPTQLNQIPRH